jgi:hypothetical protein
MIDLNSFLTSPKSKIKFYSPYNFNKNISETALLQQQFDVINELIIKNDYEIVSIPFRISKITMGFRLF